MERELQETRGRGGRPPAANAGDVEARLLASATRLFLERGYDGTSCDQVALDARAGKASIYSRYASKSALFKAVIEHLLAGTPTQEDVVQAMPLEDRLAAIGMTMLEDALAVGALALLRLMVAEAHKLADTTPRADQLFWQAGVKRVSAVIAQHEPENAAAASPLAGQFIEMVLAPVLLRALLGEATAPLLAGSPVRIATAIALLRLNGTLNGWT